MNTIKNPLCLECEKLILKEIQSDKYERNEQKTKARFYLISIGID